MFHTGIMHVNITVTSILTLNIYKYISSESQRHLCYARLAGIQFRGNTSIFFFLFFFFLITKSHCLSIRDETGSVDCNQAAEQLYLQPVLGWLIKRRHWLLSCKSRNLYLGSVVCLFVCLLRFIDFILRVDSRGPMWMFMSWIISLI